MRTHTPQLTQTFSRALDEMRASCDLVCSAPMSAILSGEHAVLDGAPLLAAPLPLRVYVGSLGRNLVDAGGPALATFRYFDPLTREVVDSARDPGLVWQEFGVEGFRSALKEAVTRIPKARFLPAEVYVLSALPPARGPNWSGAVAAAMSILLDLLQGGVSWPSKEGDPDGGGQSLNGGVARRRFRTAMAIERGSHGSPSGYGPACALADALGQLLVYRMLAPKTTYRAADEIRCSVRPMELRSLGARRAGPASESVVDMALIDTGRPKSTASSIRFLREVVERRLAAALECAIGGVDELSELRLASDKTADGSSPDTERQELVANSAMGALSALLIAHLSSARGADGPMPDFVALVRAIDAVHCVAGLSFPELDGLRTLVETQSPGLAIKLTGGGRGGAALVVGLRDEIDRLLETPESEPGMSGVVVWRLSRDGLALDGAKLEHSAESLPFGRRVGSFPRERVAVAHRATLFLPSGECLVLPEVSASLSDAYRAVFSTPMWERGVFLYVNDDLRADRYEPVFFSWRQQFEEGVTRVTSEQLRCVEGAWAIRRLLEGFAERRETELVRPEAREPSGRRTLLPEEVESAIAAFNGRGEHLSAALGGGFPRLSLRPGKAVSVRLHVPTGACLAIIRAAGPDGQTNLARIGRKS